MATGVGNGERAEERRKETVSMVEASVKSDLAAAEAAEQESDFDTESDTASGDGDVALSTEYLQWRQRELLRIAEWLPKP